MKSIFRITLFLLFFTSLFSCSVEYGVTTPRPYYYYYDNSFPFYPYYYRTYPYYFYNPYRYRYSPPRHYYNPRPNPPRPNPGKPSKPNNSGNYYGPRK